MSVKLLEMITPFGVTEMKTTGRERKRKRVSSSAFLPEAEHTLFSFIMS